MQLVLAIKWQKNCSLGVKQQSKKIISSYKNDDSYSNKYSGVTLPPKKLDNNVCQK
jgi:hypothetical protein